MKNALATALREAGGGRRKRSRARPSPWDSRRVAVKVRFGRVDQDWGRKAAKLHLRYLERDGVREDGPDGGVLYGEKGPVARTDFEEELRGEKRQYRIVISPEDGQELDLTPYVQTYMRRVEKDLGQKLRWVAANHYNTDNPHAHVVVRGIDAKGAEVTMGRDYVSHGLRGRAVELANQWLGPRPERSRLDQWKREAELERYTSLDAVLERRVRAGAAGASRTGDPSLESAVKRRLQVLETLGLARVSQKGEYELAPHLRDELDRMQRRAEGLRAIGSVLQVSGDRCRVIDRSEPKEGHRAELERGIEGIVRWKGLDEGGRFCLVVETTSATAYYLPISDRVAQEAVVGQVVEIKRAVDKDERIEAAARNAGWSYDLNSLPEESRAAYRGRLEQLERMKLAAPDGTNRWRVKPTFRSELAKGKQQPYWQMVAVRQQSQRLEAQIRYEGHVWLDRVQSDRLGHTGFGREVREALRRREEFIQSLGLDPRSDKLRWELQRRQQQRLQQRIASVDGGEPTRPRPGFEGTARVHREANGERFVEVRSGQEFFVRPAGVRDDALDGQRVRVQLGEKGRVVLSGAPREPDRDR